MLRTLPFQPYSGLFRGFSAELPALAGETIPQTSIQAGPDSRLRVDFHI